MENCYENSILNTRGFIPLPILFIIRVILAIYLILTIIYSIFYNDNIWFAYFTHWMYLLLAMYFVVAIFFMLWKLKFPKFGEQGSKTERYIFLFLQHFFVLVNTGGPFVTTVFWAFLSETDTVSTLESFNNITLHALNTVIITIDFILARQDYSKKQVYIIIVTAIVYEAFLLCFYQVTGIWIYSILNYNKSKIAIGYYIGLPVLAAVYFIIDYCLAKYVLVKLNTPLPSKDNELPVIIV